MTAIDSTGIEVEMDGGADGVTSTTEADAAEDGFERVLTKEERRKRKKVEKHRPQFHFDMSAYKAGRKIGIAVSGQCLFLV